jgi:hypothetical protein
MPATRAMRQGLGVGGGEAYDGPFFGGGEGRGHREGGDGDAYMGEAA